jgi:hypothetical protein
MIYTINIKDSVNYLKIRYKMIYTINIKDSVNYLKICESYINPEDDNCNEHCNVFWGVALCSLVDTDQLMMETVSSYKMLTSYLPDCKLL